MSNWEILRADGRYVGRSSAHSAETALCQCMVTSGLVIKEVEIQSMRLSDGSFRLAYRGDVFLLTGYAESPAEIVPPSRSFFTKVN